LEGQTGILPGEVHNDIEETAMLRATTLKIADNIIVRCQGGIVVGEDLAALRRTVMKDCSAKLVLLDMAGVRGIDAGGLGVLLGLRQWAENNSTRFKLMNVRPKVERVIKTVWLDRVFEFSTVHDISDLIHLPNRARSWKRRTQPKKKYSSSKSPLPG